MKKSIEEEFLTEIEDGIKKRKSSKKRINSKRKGSGAELELSHMLNDRFKGHIFARSVASGAYTGGMNAGRAQALTNDQKLCFAGDIRVPVDFKFSIEHKFYEKMEFWDLFNASSDLHSWMGQAQHDADSVNRSPMLVCKFNNKKRIVFIHEKPIEPVFATMKWNCYWLDDLFKLDDSFFFNSK